jgi:hypothetical protein
LLGDAAEPPPVRVEIGAADEDGSFTLQLTLRDETRTLRDPSCRTLFRSAIVVVAAALRGVDPTPAATAERADPTPAATAERAYRIEPTASPAPSAAAARADQKARWLVGTAVGGGGTLGLLPALAPRVELSGSLEREPMGALIALHYLSRVDEQAASGRGVGVTAVGGRLAMLVIPVRFIRFAAGAELDWLHGAGVGSAQRLSDTAWAVAALAEVAGVPLRLGHARIELALSGQWNFVRPRFEIVGYGEVYRVPNLGGSALIRLAWSFY